MDIKPPYFSLSIAERAAGLDETRVILGVAHPLVQASIRDQTVKVFHVLNALIVFVKRRWSLGVGGAWDL